MELTIADILGRAEQLFGAKEAVVCGDVRLTYAEFGRACRRLASVLRDHGVGRGDRVAILGLNSDTYLAAYFAVPAMGAVLVPLNNRHAVAEHRYILEDAEVRVLLVDDAHAETAAAAAEGVKDVLRIGAELDALLVAAGEGEALGVGVGEDDLASLFYTGGTTGASKGVMLTHRSVVANALHSMVGFGYRPDDVYLHAGPMFHLADGLSTYAMTWLGARHAFVPAFDADAVLDVVERERVTCSFWVPTMLNLLIGHPRIGSADLGSLRLIGHGGAPIATDLLRRSVEALGCSFTQAYGTTEAGPLLTMLPREENLVGDPTLRSAGQPIVGVAMDIRHEDGRSCEVGEVGEVVARGPAFMVGYWNKPEQTAAVLRDGWYHTGDLGYRDEHWNVYLVDRAKDMIVSGGENVYSTEVEEVVAAHPAVAEVAVVGIPDDEWGECVHAVVALRPGATLDIDELRSFCKERIAGYKSPRSMEVVDALPKSGAGKILKREVRERHWAGRDRRIG